MTRKDIETAQQYMGKRHVNRFIRTMINHKESHIHEHREFIISKQKDFFALINIYDLNFRLFDNKEDAVNGILDKTIQKNHKQGKLF